MNIKHTFFVLIFYFLLLNVALNAQNNKIDSLIKIYENTDNDTVRINTLLEIGYFYFEVSENDSSIYFYEKALNESILADKWVGKYRANYMLGLVYAYKSFYSISEEYFLDALKVAEQNNDANFQVNALNGLGGVYEDKMLYDKSLKYYFDALILAKEENDKEQITSLLNNIGLIYQNIKDYDKAKEYLNKSFEISKEIDFKEAIAAYYMNYGLIFKDQNKYAEALKYYKKSFNLYKDFGDNYSIAICYENFGDLYVDMKEYNKAEYYYNKAIELNEKVEDLRSNASILIGIAKLYKRKHNTKKAIKNCKKSILISKDIGALDILKEGYGNLADCYYTLNNYKEAYNYFVKFKIVNDSINNIDNKLKIKELEIKNKREEEKKELEILKINQLKSELSLKKEKKIRTILVFSLLFMSIFLLILILLIIKLKKTRKEIQEKDEDFEALLDANNDVVFIISATGKQLYYNKRVESLYGYKREELIGKSFTDFVEKSEISVYLSKLKEVFLRRRIKPFQTVGIHKNGTKIPIEVSGRVIRYKNRIVAVGTIKDISDRVKTENKIKEINKSFNRTFLRIYNGRNEKYNHI